MTNRIKLGKHGLLEDPRGLLVKMQYQGRQLLGRVQSVRYRETPGAFVLSVSHFCGDAWPLEPAVSAVEVI